MLKWMLKKPCMVFAMTVRPDLGFETHVSYSTPRPCPGAGTQQMGLQDQAEMHLQP